MSRIELKLAARCLALERWIAPMHCTIGLFSDPTVLPNIVLLKPSLPKLRSVDSGASGQMAAFYAMRRGYKHRKKGTLTGLGCDATSRQAT